MFKPLDRIGNEKNSENPDNTEILTGKRILLVEDDKVSQLISKRVLEKAGCIVTVASNGKEAVDIVLSQGQTFDLILMDILMPVMNGTEATKILRAQNVRIPIISTTTITSPEEIASFLAVGIDGYIPKVFSAEDVSTKFREILDTI